MNLLKTIIIGLFLLISTASLHAEQDKSALIIEYLELSKTKETLDMTIEAYVEQLSSQAPNAKKEELREFFNAYMGWEALKEPIMKIVEKHLSIQEIKDINDFYKTKSGRSLAEKSPKMSADISSIIAINIQRAMHNMQKNQSK